MAVVGTDEEVPDLHELKAELDVLGSVAASCRPHADHIGETFHKLHH